MILFVSDNGAAPFDRRFPHLNVEPTNGNIGLGDGTGWAWARNAPFRFYKQNQYEGGIGTPGRVSQQVVHLTDVFPTVLAAAGHARVNVHRPPRVGIITTGDEMIRNLEINGGETWYQMEMMLTTGLDISPIITHRMKADNFQDAFDIMETGNCGKIILDWE